MAKEKKEGEVSQNLPQWYERWIEEYVAIIADVMLEQFSDFFLESFDPETGFVPIFANEYTFPIPMDSSKIPEQPETTSFQADPIRAERESLIQRGSVEGWTAIAVRESLEVGKFSVEDSKCKDKPNATVILISRDFYPKNEFGEFVDSTTQYSLIGQLPFQSNEEDNKFIPMPIARAELKIIIDENGSYSEYRFQHYDKNLYKKKDYPQPNGTDFLSESYMNNFVKGSIFQELVMYFWDVLQKLPENIEFVLEISEKYEKFLIENISSLLKLAPEFNISKNEDFSVILNPMAGEGNLSFHVNHCLQVLVLRRGRELVFTDTQYILPLESYGADVLRRIQDYLDRKIRETITSTNFDYRYDIPVMGFLNNSDYREMNRILESWVPTSFFQNAFSPKILDTIFSNEEITGNTRNVSAFRSYASLDLRTHRYSLHTQERIPRNPDEPADAERPVLFERSNSDPTTQREMLQVLLMMLRTIYDTIKKSS